jgi:hypothetical protein
MSGQCHPRLVTKSLHDQTQHTLRIIAIMPHEPLAYSVDIKALYIQGTMDHCSVD